jgi:hypothetical protein
MEHINKKRNNEFSCDNSLHQSRFKTTLSLMRLGGMSLNITSLSNVYKLYYTVGVVCYYTTLICIFMDVYVHRYDLVQCMKKTPVLLAFSFCEWLKQSLRYVRHELKVYRNISNTQ